MDCFALLPSRNDGGLVLAFYGLLKRLALCFANARNDDFAVRVTKEEDSASQATRAKRALSVKPAINQIQAKQNKTLALR